jgi:hypothetical protein
MQVGPGQPPADENVDGSQFLVVCHLRHSVTMETTSSGTAPKIATGPFVNNIVRNQSYTPGKPGTWSRKCDNNKGAWRPRQLKSGQVHVPHFEPPLSKIPRSHRAPFTMARAGRRYDFETTGDHALTRGLLDAGAIAILPTPPWLKSSLEKSPIQSVCLTRIGCSDAAQLVEPRERGERYQLVISGGPDIPVSHDESLSAGADEALRRCRECSTATK